MFDPYRKWLGIPPKDQPPNHYRLLGVEIFEDDLDVIEGAFDRQMSFVRQYQSGEHAADAARILNELANARLCLLKPATKAEYDQKLRREQKATESATEVPVESAFADLELSAPTPEVRNPSKKQKKATAASGNKMLVIGGCAAGVVCLLVVVFFLSGGRKPVPVHQTTPVPIASNTTTVPDSSPVQTTTPEPAKTNSTADDVAYAPAPVSAEPVGKPIDLLKQVDVSRDSDKGEVRPVADSLIIRQVSRVHLPAKLPEEYQVRLKVRRTEGNEHLYIGFMNNGRAGELVLDARNSAISSVLIDSRDVDVNCTTFRGSLFQDTQLATIVLTVRPGRIHLKFNDLTVIDWRGSPQRLNVYASGSRESLMLESGQSSFVVESASLVQIKPELTPANRKPQLEQIVDVIPRIDLDRDTKDGVWSISKGTLSSPESSGILRLPVITPDEYTLSFLVERPAQAQGEPTLIIGVPSPGNHGQIVLKNDDCVGLEAVDGFRWRENLVRRTGTYLAPGVPAKVDCTVAGDSIRMEIDGKTVIDWKGASSRVSTTGDWIAADARRLYLGVKSHFKIRDLKLGPPLPAPVTPTAAPAVGKDIDLLALINPARDTLNGKFEKDGDSLKITEAAGWSRLVIPFTPPEEYKLTMRVKRELGAINQTGELDLSLPFGSINADVMIDYASEPRATGVYVDYRPAFDNVTTYRGMVIPLGPTVDIEVTVRRTGLKIVRGQDTILDWTGNPERFSWSERAVPGNQLALGSFHQLFRFEKLRLETLEPTAPVEPKVDGTGKLLPVINVQRDTRRGNWVMANNTLVSPDDIEFPRLRLPQPPKNYVFRAVVERQTGENDLRIGLPFGRNPGVVLIDGNGGKFAGLERLDNARIVHGQNLTRRQYSPALLPKGQTVEVRCQVLPDTLVVHVDNVEVIRWHGDSRRLSVETAYQPPNYTEADQTHLWIGSHQSRFVFKDLELLPMSDEQASQLAKQFTGVFPTTSQADVPLNRTITTPAPTPTPTPSVPVVTDTSPKDEKSWLLDRKTTGPALIVISEFHGAEREAAMEGCRTGKIGFDLARSFPPAGFDYKHYGMIVTGTNIMDEWAAPERKHPAAFQPIVDFVKAGGHLIVFNTFNGRNMEHMQQFGITTGFNHSNSYQMVPGKSEMLFDGVEDLIPPGNYLKQSGHVVVTAPHAVMLQRGPGSQEGDPTVVTLRVGKGRVTYSTVEPTFGFPRGFWMMQAVVRWAARGAPVTAHDMAVLKSTSKPKPAGARRAIVMDAKYGSDDALVDIKPAIMNAIKSQVLIVAADSSLTGGDPAPDKPKFLHLKLRIDGNDEYLRFSEYYIANVDLRPPPSASPSQTFKLLEARWGTGIYSTANWVNVTPKLKIFIKDNGIRVGREEFDRTLADVPDPGPNLWKSLVVHYQFQGRDLYSVFPRGASIELGDQPAGAE